MMAEAFREAAKSNCKANQVTPENILSHHAGILSCLGKSGSLGRETLAYISARSSRLPDLSSKAPALVVSILTRADATN